MRAVVLLVAAACGTSASTKPIGNRAAPPPKPTCDDDRIAAIAAYLHARWNTSEPPLVRCTPGLFPTRGFYILTEDRAGILADDGETELVPFVAVPPNIIACATVDLNGDGVDEIVETLRDIDRASTTQWLEVQRIADGRLERVRGPHTSVDHRDLGGCHAEVKLAGRTIVIDVEHAPGIPPSDCLAPGTHAFALGKRALVKI
jgi:hypothetical protein